MLTPSEMEAIESALVAARAEVARLEAIADAEDANRLPGWRWLVPSQARRVATTARDLVEMLQHVRNAIVESPDYNHEEAERVVQFAREAAEPGFTARAIENATVGDAIASGEAWHAAKRAAGSLVPWWAWALIVVALLVVLTPTLAAVGTFFAARRRA